MGFGMIPLRGEGAPIHPDDPDHGYGFEDPRSQAFSYFDYYGDSSGHEGLSYYEEWKCYTKKQKG